MDTISSFKINNLRKNARSVVRELGLLNDAFFDIGVTLVERHLLIEIASSKDLLTAKEIAKRLLLEKSTVSRLIARAEKKNFIACSICTSDKRKRLLKLTNHGQQTLDAFESIAFKQTKEALQELSPSEIETVSNGVSLYAQGLRIARKEEKKKIEKIQPLKEIYAQLEHLGCSLESCKPEDEEALYAIFKTIVETKSQFPYESSSKKEFLHHFFSEGASVYICRTTKKEVIGGFYLKANYRGRSNHIANAAYMIHPLHQGKGLGSLLTSASMYFSKEKGYKALQYNMVLSQNTRAIHLYQKLGFAIIGNIPNAIRNPDNTFQNGLVMYRPLEDL